MRGRSSAKKRWVGARIDPTKTGIVIVDPWNYHWCMTASERFAAMAPRMNRALAAARKLGMQVFWAPTDVAYVYAGWPQRQRAMAVPYVDLPKTTRAVKIEIPDKQVRGGTLSPCMCGPGLCCPTNFGWDGINPELNIAAEDLIIGGTREFYSLLQQKGITHLIYLGGHTNYCLVGKPAALRSMYSYGIECYLGRDLTDAQTYYDPAKPWTPDDGTAKVVAMIEAAGVPTIDLVEEMKKAGTWEDDGLFEKVRVTPWGTAKRPFFFEHSVTVSLRVPLVKDVEIRYTLDGSEPRPGSGLYEKSLELKETTTLRAAAFCAGKPVSLESQGYFMHLPPLPPKPDVTLDKATPMPFPNVGLDQIFMWQPKVNLSYESKPLRIRKQDYPGWLGMRSPSFMRYEVKPEWKRFVALAGVDDNLLDIPTTAVRSDGSQIQSMGASVAAYAGLVFRVFIDGVQAAESPVMRLAQEPWRFDVPIPEGSRQICLVCDYVGSPMLPPAGAQNPYNLGNWVEAGWCLGKEAEPPGSKDR